MNTKRYVLGSLAVFAVIFVFEWIFHGMFLKDLYNQTAAMWRPQDECVFPALATGQLILAFIFTLIFTKGYENKGIAEGIRYGVLIGMLFVPGHLMFYAVQPLPPILVIYWCIGGIIEMILAGAALAAVYKS